MRVGTETGRVGSTRAVRGAAFAVAAFAATAIGLAAAPPTLKSAWRDRDVKIDGVNDEWQANTTYIQDDQLSIGLQNDGEYLYAMVSTSEPRRRIQLLSTGLTLWVDASGRKKQTFGILVPGAGFGGGGIRQRGEGGPAGRGRPAGEGRQAGEEGPDPDAMLERLNQPVTYFELIGPGKDDRRRLELAAGPGIEISRGVHEGMVTYEFKIPLAHSEAHRFGIETVAGRTVGLGLETPKREDMMGARGLDVPGRSGGRGGGIGGGMGGGGGRGGFGRGGGMGGGGSRGAGEGGGRGGERMQPLTPLKMWTTATLATEAR
jgi:hypothetical protein